MGCVSTGGRRRSVVMVATAMLMALVSSPAGARVVVTAPPPAGTPIQLTRDLTVTAVGDLVMGSRPYGLPRDGGRSLFTRVKPLLVGDIVMANLEGTLARDGRSKCGPSSGPFCFAFRTPPSYAQWLPKAGIDVVNVANNHIDDFGAVGRRQTRAALNRVGVRHTGWPGSIAYLQTAGGTVAVIGFGFERTNQNTILNLPAARALVAEAAAHAGVVIVTMHSGAEGRSAQHLTFRREIFLGENRGNPTAFARAMVDAGADLVVGHGPHVMRAMELYKGRLIAYSMGNFMGYAVFNISGASGQSGVVSVTLAPDGHLVGGKLTSLRLVGRGVPVPGGTSVAKVRALTAQDLGGRGAKIAVDGAIAGAPTP